ncbi:unnamed protein product [Fraxinus pennsylvanica]|uniref:EXS domain-containing protein n=1 Tax=Fraxinus pennsylvanica TaxID=56036 RepID=A0AAD2DJE7_9LAMI|nr:unnamed protein product [Fraxinus pennsylvanica]
MQNTSRRAARSYMKIVDNSYIGRCDELRRHQIAVAKIEERKTSYNVFLGYLMFNASNNPIWVLFSPGPSYLFLVFDVFLNNRKNGFKWTLILVVLAYCEPTISRLVLKLAALIKLKSLFTFIPSQHHFYIVQYCVRRLFEEEDIAHGYNGLRYFLTIVAVVIRTAFELKKQLTWQVLALVSSVIATMFNTYWDVFVNWGLLQIKSKNLFLREKLLVSRKSVYFAAMIIRQYVCHWDLCSDLNFTQFQQLMSIPAAPEFLISEPPVSFLHVQQERKTSDFCIYTLLTLSGMLLCCFIKPHQVSLICS